MTFILRHVFDPICFFSRCPWASRSVFGGASSLRLLRIHPGHGLRGGNGVDGAAVGLSRPEGHRNANQGVCDCCCRHLLSWTDLGLVDDDLPCSFVTQRRHLLPRDVVVKVAGAGAGAVDVFVLWLFSKRNDGVAATVIRAVSCRIIRAVSCHTAGIQKHRPGTR